MARSFSPAAFKIKLTICLKWADRSAATAAAAAAAATATAAAMCAFNIIAVRSSSVPCALYRTAC